MTQRWGGWYWHFGLASLLAAGGAISTFGDSALAQIRLGTIISPATISAVNTAIRARRISTEPSSTLPNSRWQFVDITNLVEPGCSGVNTFIITGRGGLPPNPSDPLRSDAVRVSLDKPIPGKENRATAETATNPTSAAPAPLVEAQGWLINNKGEVVLIAHAPNVTPNVPWLTPATCHGSATSHQ